MKVGLVEPWAKAEHANGEKTMIERYEKGTRRAYCQKEVCDS